MMSRHVMSMPVDLRAIDGVLSVVSLSLPRRRPRGPFLIDDLYSWSDVLRPDPSAPPSGLSTPTTPNLVYDLRDPRVAVTPARSYIASSRMEVARAPKLFLIFHISRCGSTLASQMLSAVGDFFSLSQPTIISRVLDPRLDISENLRKDLLRAAIERIGACAPEGCQACFIKFESWNILYADVVQSAATEASTLVIHRHTLEVAVSIEKHGANWLRERLTLQGHFRRFLGDAERVRVESMHDDEYVAAMLGAFCRAGRLATHGGSGECLAYDDLLRELPAMVTLRWGLELSAQDLGSMMERSRIDAKDSAHRKLFSPDGDRKRMSATTSQSRLADRLSEPWRASLMSRGDPPAEQRPTRRRI